MNQTNQGNGQLLVAFEHISANETEKDEEQCYLSSKVYDLFVEIGDGKIKKVLHLLSIHTNQKVTIKNNCEGADENLSDFRNETDLGRGTGVNVNLRITSYVAVRCREEYTIYQVYLLGVSLLFPGRETRRSIPHHFHCCTKGVYP